MAKKKDETKKVSPREEKRSVQDKFAFINRRKQIRFHPDENSSYLLSLFY